MNSFIVSDGMRFNKNNSPINETLPKLLSFSL